MSIKEIPRRGDSFVTELKNVKVIDILPESSKNMYSPKLAQMGTVQDGEGLEIPFHIWQKSIYAGTPLLKLNQTYSFRELFTSDRFGEVAIQLNKNTKIETVKKQVSDFIDLGQFEKNRSYKKINVKIANNNYLKNKLYREVF
jgi:hypothetical protein